MNFKMYLHKILMETDDFYRSLDGTQRFEYLKKFSNTLIGIRTKLAYYIDKYIRRTIK